MWCVIYIFRVSFWFSVWEVVACNEGRLVFVFENFQRTRQLRHVNERVVILLENVLHIRQVLVDPAHALYRLPTQIQITVNKIQRYDVIMLLELFPQ